MRHTAAEKLEFIRLVDGSDLSVKATLKKLGIHWMSRTPRSIKAVAN